MGSDVEMLLQEIRLTNLRARVGASHCGAFRRADLRSLALLFCEPTFCGLLCGLPYHQMSPNLRSFVSGRAYAPRCVCVCVRSSSHYRHVLRRNWDNGRCHLTLVPVACYIFHPCAE